MAKVRLVHIIPDIRTTSANMYVLDLVMRMRDFAHTVMVEYEPGGRDDGLVHHLISAGADVRFISQSCANGVIGAVDRRVTPDMLSGCFDAMILHSISDHPTLGKTLPSIYYAYGYYDPLTYADVLLCPSDRARFMGRTGEHVKPMAAHTKVLPPAIDARRLRRTIQRPTEFTVGLSTSAWPQRFPQSFVKTLLGNLPADIHLYLNIPHELTAEFHAIIQVARPHRTYVVPVKCMPERNMIHRVNALLYATPVHYHSPYCRTVLEAMAAGTIVIGQNVAALPAGMKHEHNCLLFQQGNALEAIQHIINLQKSKNLVEQVSANAKMLAFEHDHTIYTGELRSLLLKMVK